MHQSEENFSKIKKCTPSSTKSYNTKNLSQLHDVESQIGSLLINWKIVSLTRDGYGTLSELFKIKWGLLAYEETKSRLKSKAPWIKEGNNNTKYFNIHANYHKVINSIWEIELFKWKDSIKV